MTFKELKANQKELAKLIRTKKSKRKKAKYGYVEGLFEAQYKYRIWHVIYCLLRGRTLEQIERKCHPHNELRLSTLRYYLEQIEVDPKYAEKYAAVEDFVNEKKAKAA